jgi:hypothetical protein
MAEIDPDMVVNFEHDGGDYGQLEGLSLAAQTSVRPLQRLSNIRREGRVVTALARASG